MKTVKQTMIDKITETIKSFGEQIRNDKNLSLEDKCDQMDVLLDVFRFLDNYDKNIEILNDYYLSQGKWENIK